MVHHLLIVQLPRHTEGEVWAKYFMFFYIYFFIIYIFIHSTYIHSSVTQCSLQRVQFLFKHLYHLSSCLLSFPRTYPSYYFLASKPKSKHSDTNFATINFFFYITLFWPPVNLLCNIKRKPGKKCPDLKSDLNSFSNRATTKITMNKTNN